MKNALKTKMFQGEKHIFIKLMEFFKKLCYTKIKLFMIKFTNANVKNFHVSKIWTSLILLLAPPKWKYLFFVKFWKMHRKLKFSVVKSTFSSNWWNFSKSYVMRKWNESWYNSPMRNAKCENFHFSKFLTGSFLMLAPH